ncbi:hypothetical protein [Gordonia sp. (in: high G+C Gram-positive bacteria)]|uniref:hypothetical protein n=1 Tax=Gordonia sp. (in: high G+C Gram-positive bacteria) TaxID=84139 RepID=UPI003C77B376
MDARIGYSVAEIEKLVEEYLDLPRGTKKAWLQEKGLTDYRFNQWRRAYLDGDLERGLIPRGRPQSASVVKSAQQKLRALEKSVIAERAAYEKQLEALRAENEILTEGSIALGKALGLLQKISPPESETSM